jgi:hypothetical protein
LILGLACFRFDRFVFGCGSSFLSRLSFRLGLGFRRGGVSLSFLFSFVGRGHRRLLAVTGATGQGGDDNHGTDQGKDITGEGVQHGSDSFDRHHRDRVITLMNRPADPDESRAS